MSGFKRRGADLVVIGLSVVAFNVVAVLGLDVLLHDDPAWYGRVLDGRFPWQMVGYAWLAPFKEWAAWNVMALSPNLARGLYVLLLMVPLSLLFYHLFRVKFGLPRSLAIAAAVLPNALPGQWQIPAGINMSYHLWGLLLAVISLILGLSDLDDASSRSPARWIGAVLCFAAASQLMEQTLFLAPPFMAIYWGYRARGPRRGRLVLSVALISGLRLAQMILFPRTPIVLVSAKDVFKRIAAWIQWSLPAPPAVDSVYPAALFVLIVVAGALVLLNGRTRRKIFPMGLIGRGDAGVVAVFAFLGLWSVSNIAVFLFMTEWFSPRYAHISSFGLNALLLLSLYAILGGDASRKRPWPTALCAVLVLYAGVARSIHLRRTFDPLNANRVLIEQTLAPLTLPPYSQVVLAGLAGIPGGWERSSGYLKFVLKRPDIFGLIGRAHPDEYFNYGDHFNPKERRWKTRYTFTGLDLKKPVFLFLRRVGEQRLEQLEYALQWKGVGMDAPWTVFRFDKSNGRGEPCVSGTGWDEYTEALRRLEGRGVRQTDILWGGPPFPEEWPRLREGL